MVLAITGASGMPLALELVQEIKKCDYELHLIVSSAAREVLALEAPGFERYFEQADYLYDQEQLSAPMASGSFRHAGMAICPCSMSSLAAVAQGLGNNLIHRAADVTLKESRNLVLVPRETPLSRIHLKNMLRAREAGAVILPPTPAFYNQPENIQDIIRHVVSRILDALGIENQVSPRWEGL